MKGQAYINGKDIWLTWGAMLAKGTYERLLKPAPMKEFVSNSSRLEHGVRIVANPNVARTEQREIQIQFIIEGGSENDYLEKSSSFMSELEKGIIEFNVVKLKTIYKLVYTDCSSYGNYGNKMGKFTVKFIEPNTKDRIVSND
jgi:hypothetical protein